MHMDEITNQLKSVAGQIADWQSKMQLSDTELCWRFAGLGCFIDDVPLKHLAGRFGVRSLFGNFISVRGANRFANSQGPRHHFPSFVASQLPHFRTSVINAPNLARGGHDEIHEHSTCGAANDC
jgi:hypothetical protein